VRRRLPDLPIVKYVSPTVWVWRPGRARAMRRSIDLVLAVLPFEPDVHRRWAGRLASMSANPLLAQLDALRPRRKRRAPRGHAFGAGASGQPAAGRFGRLGAVFARRWNGRRKNTAFRVVLPTLPHLADEIAAVISRWSIRRASSRRSGETRGVPARPRGAGGLRTVTLELALAGVPTSPPIVSRSSKV